VLLRNKVTSCRDDGVPASFSLPARKQAETTGSTTTEQDEYDTADSFIASDSVTFRSDGSYATEDDPREEESSSEDSSDNDNESMARRGTEDSVVSSDEGSTMDDRDSNSIDLSGGLRRSRRITNNHKTPEYEEDSINSNVSVFKDDFSASDYEHNVFGNDDDDGASVKSHEEIEGKSGKNYGCKGRVVCLLSSLSNTMIDASVSPPMKKQRVDSTGKKVKSTDDYGEYGYVYAGPLPKQKTLKEYYSPLPLGAERVASGRSPGRDDTESNEEAWSSEEVEISAKTESNGDDDSSVEVDASSKVDTSSKEEDNEVDDAAGENSEADEASEEADKSSEEEEFHDEFSHGHDLVDTDEEVEISAKTEEGKYVRLKLYCDV
jgi:hypothetical protein